jgi:hypothetical protein
MRVDDGSAGGDVVASLMCHCAMRRKALLPFSNRVMPPNGRRDELRRGSRRIDHEN